MFIVVESFPTKLTKIPTTANPRPAQNRLLPCHNPITYSQLASAKLAICRKKSFFGQSKFSFLRGLRLIVGMVAGFYAVFAFWGLNAGGQVGDGMVFERLIAKREHQMGFID
jgi:hypothetical protein